jgi:hypothetical protein
MPFVGEVLPLSYQLLDGDTTKFVRVALTDEAGTPLAGSPFAMPHLALGKYSSSAVVMPAGVDYIEATYEPFNDAPFTVPDPDHLFGTDVFRLEVPDSVIVAKLDEIIAKLEGLALPGASFNAILVQNKVKEVINDAKFTKALIEGQDIKGLLMEEKNIKGLVDQGQIKGEIDK